MITTSAVGDYDPEDRLQLHMKKDTEEITKLTNLIYNLRKAERMQLMISGYATKVEV